MNADRYALLTVDTEALPRRATSEHVKRLIWGVHEHGAAGVRELCAAGDEVGAKHVFFVDMCGCYTYRDEMTEVITWLDTQGQDVQLHVHPEYLPQSFWVEHGVSEKPHHLNQCDDAKAAFVIQHFAAMVSGITGKPLRAFRAGSFRWNAATLRALAGANIPLSFNNTMCARSIGQCPFSLPTNLPYRWSNGIIEVPVTEKSILPRMGKAWWARLQYPQSRFFRYRPWLASFLPYSAPHDSSLLVFLMHSWSLLYWDEQGCGVYKDDARIEGYRTLLKRVAKDYDIITTADFLDLVEQGKIQLTHTEDVTNAELPKKARR